MNSTFVIGKGNKLIQSQYIGDLSKLSVQNSYQDMGAHSYNGKTRLSNRSDLRMYINEENYTDEEHLSEKDIFNDYILTTIRVMEGMDISDAKLRFGEEKIKHILSIAEKYIKDGKLEISDNRLRLTADGIFISDTIMSDMMIIDD